MTASYTPIILQVLSNLEVRLIHQSGKYGISLETKGPVRYIQQKLGKKAASLFTFLVLPSVVSSQKPTEKSSLAQLTQAQKNAAGSVCTTQRGKHVETQYECCSRMTFDCLVSPPKMNQYACTQACVQNRYIFCPDDAREVRRYSVLSSLTVERECEQF